MDQEIKRGPGRPPKYHEKIEPVAPVVSSNPDPILPRSARKPFGAMEQKLDYAKRDGFHRHWFNDVGNRISRAEEAGYKHVLSNDGKPVSKIVGTLEGGGAMSGFLMELPEEWFKADMAEQQKEVDAREQAMKRGKLDDQLGDKGYVPAQGISIGQR